MPYEPIGQFNPQQGTSRKHDFRRPVTFYDRVRFEGANSTLEIFGGVFTGDIYSSGWDGVTPLDLSTADTNANAGYALDDSEGAAQFMGSLFVGGSLDLLLGGSIRALDSGGTSQVTITLDDSTKEIIFGGDARITGTFSAVNAYGDDKGFRGVHLIDAKGGTTPIDGGIFSGHTGAGGNYSWWHYPRSVSDGENFYGVSLGDFGFGGGGEDLVTGVVPDWYFDAGHSLRMKLGVAGTPAYSFIDDPDTGIFRRATNDLGFTAGGNMTFFSNATYAFFAGSNTTGSAVMPRLAGTEALPAFTFGAQYDLGMYRRGANSLGFSVGGTMIMYLASNVMRGANINNTPFIVFGVAGTAASPTYSFNADTGIGMYRVSASNLGFAVAGAKIMTLGSTAMKGNGTLGSPLIRMQVTGSFAAPIYSFDGDTDTGMYRKSANVLAFTGGGAIKLELNGTTGFFSTLIYNISTGSAANVNILSTGLLRRFTSARKYKSRINYNMDHLADIELKPVKFYRKDDKRWFLGLVADDVYEEEPLLGMLDDKGEIENYDMNAVVATIIAKVNRLEKLVLTQ